MSHRRIGATALILGAAAGAVVGAALITSPMAYATDPPLANPLDVFTPPGEAGDRTISDESSFPYLYNFFHANTPYTIYDQAHDVVGTYDIQDTSLVAGIVPVIAFLHQTGVVTDSTGAAPPDGTLWDGMSFGWFFPQVNFFENDYTSSPDGTSADFFGILPGIGNFFSTGPTGILDELVFFGTWVPVIDSPF